MTAATPIAPAVAPPAAHEIWQEFHWAFFLDTQGLILCLRRFDRLLERGEIDRAGVELETAAELMEASGAAMRLAGSFTADEYHQQIRVAMTPPNVVSERFSGLMSWEHAALVQLWRSLRGRFADLPEPLKPAHAAFAAAYRGMADSHVHVCARFMGSDARSLRYDDRDAIQNLVRFGRSRLAMIQPAAPAEAPPTPGDAETQP